MTLTILRALQQPGGDSVKVIVAPAQVGKSWVINEVARRLTAVDMPPASAQNWEIRRIDLRDPQNLDGIFYHDADFSAKGATRTEGLKMANRNVNALLQSFFQLTDDFVEDISAVYDIRPNRVACSDAIQLILTSNVNWLCILDSAELLDADTIRQFKRIFQYLQRELEDFSGGRLTLAFLTATRRIQQAWDNLPRYPSLELSPFPRQVLRSLVAEKYEKNLYSPVGDEAVRSHTELLLHVTMGLPGLITGYIEWMSTNVSRVERYIDRAEVFEQLTVPYVEDEILSYRSLMPLAQTFIEDEVQCEQERRLLAMVFLELSSYRWFSLSNLGLIIEEGPVLIRKMVYNLEQGLDDIWRNIHLGGLVSEQKQPRWSAIYPEIRTILFRYAYRSQNERLEASRSAYEFMMELFVISLQSSISNTEDIVICSVECLRLRMEISNYESNAEDVFRALIETYRFITSQMLEHLGAVQTRKLNIELLDFISTNDVEFVVLADSFNDDLSGKFLEYLNGGITD